MKLPARIIFFIVDRPLLFVALVLSIILFGVTR